MVKISGNSSQDSEKQDTMVSNSSLLVCPVLPVIDYAQIFVLGVNFFICLFCVISNCLVLQVTRLSKLFPLQHILAIGDLIYSFAYVTAGPPRIFWALTGMYKDPVPGFWCLIYPWVHSFNAAIWPSTVTVAIAIERFIASLYPIWYKQNWETRFKKKYKKVVWLTVLVVISPGIILASILAAKRETTQRQGSYSRCTAVYGKGFYVFRYSYGGICAVLCAVLSATALLIGKRRRAALVLPANDKFLTNERKMEKTVAAIVVSSVLLVALPSLILVGFTLGFSALSDTPSVVRRMLIIMIILNSGINFWLYLIFNSQFRKESKRVEFIHKTLYS